MSDFRPCAVVPTYENPDTIGRVVERLKAHLDAIIVVDDGSGPAGAAAVDALQGVDVVRLSANHGKGAAVLAGFDRASEQGFTHAVQVDADDQHDIDDLPRFLEASRSAPDALVCGVPIFDASAPRRRVIGRKISVFWVNLEVGRGVIQDPLYGFRVYPVEASRAVGCRAYRMGFDTDLAVRLVWRGTPTVNLPTKVSYFEGGVTHFHPFRSNWALSRLHTGLFLRSLWWRLTGR
ncbi:MAG: glycosyltransferase family 2 protein [Proteobacteria bacterium]|nr:glycosyltransferase family 2 protein [Pseudomonadota bacterium]